MLRILLLDFGEEEVLFWLKRFTIHQDKLDTTLKTLIEMRQVFTFLDKGSQKKSFVNTKYRKSGVNEYKGYRGLPNYPFRN